MKLRKKFVELRAAGLQDMKLQYVGPRGNEADALGVTLDDLCAEVLAIIDAYEKKDFVDITETIDD